MFMIINYTKKDTVYMKTLKVIFYIVLLSVHKKIRIKLVSYGVGEMSYLFLLHCFLCVFFLIKNLAINYQTGQFYFTYATNKIRLDKLHNPSMSLFKINSAGLFHFFNQISKTCKSTKNIPGIQDCKFLTSLENQVIKKTCGYLKKL